MKPCVQKTARLQSSAKEHLAQALIVDARKLEHQYPHALKVEYGGS